MPDEGRPHYPRRDGFKDRPRANEQIRVHYVRVIGVDKKAIGILPTREAIQLARRQNLDLVELAPNADPPVAGIMDFGRYNYEQKVKERDSRRKQHSAAVREMRFMMRISENDYQTKLKKIVEFLTRHDRVRVSIRMRGREIVHYDLAIKLMDRLRTDLAPVAATEGDVTRLGEGGKQSIQLMFYPRPSTSDGKQTHGQPGQSERKTAVRRAPSAARPVKSEASDPIAIVAPEPPAPQPAAVAEEASKEKDASQ